MPTNTDDLDRALPYTDEADFTPGSLEGYDVTVVGLEEEFPRPVYVLVHTDTGVGVGTFPNRLQLDQAIEDHQAYLDSLGDVEPPRTSVRQNELDAEERSGYTVDAVDALGTTPQG